MTAFLPSLAGGVVGTFLTFFALVAKVVLIYVLLVKKALGNG